MKTIQQYCTVKEMYIKTKLTYRKKFNFDFRAHKMHTSAKKVHAVPKLISGITSAHAQ